MCLTFLLYFVDWNKHVWALEIVDGALYLGVWSIDKYRLQETFAIKQMAVDEILGTTTNISVFAKGQTELAITVTRV